MIQQEQERSPSRLERQLVQHSEVQRGGRGAVDLVCEGKQTNGLIIGLPEGSPRVSSC